jgi:hypothetical protein
LTMVNGLQCTSVRCGLCSKAAATILHDGSVQIESRHNGQTHTTVLTLRDIIKSAGKRRVEEILRSI